MQRLDFDGGYTKLPNLLIERVFCKVTFPAYEMRVLFALMRMSWGWNKAWCYSSYREIAEKTGLDYRHVRRTVQSLVEKCIVVTYPGRNKTRFEINPDYMTWKLPERNTLMPLQASLAGASTGITESEQPLDRQELVGLLRNFIKTLE
jgi:phage replication O-like protein O